MTRHLGPMRCVLRAGNALGEGIVWCDRAHVLYWTDIHAATLWRFAPATGEVRRWMLPERLASFALCESEDWLLLAFASRLAFFRLSDGAVHPLMDVEPDLPTRCNDGACDRDGRFVFGTLHEPGAGRTQRPVGGFWRLNRDLSLEPLPLGPVAISNSIAFSPDGTTMYYCDSLLRTIRSCRYGGRPGPFRAFAEVHDARGVPDGSAVDAEGGLWNAEWGLGRVVRYRPDGVADRIIEVPTRQPTKPAFGGADLATLYVTSARDGLDVDALAADPLAGALFSVPVDVRGLPEPRFAGVPPACDPRPVARMTELP